MLDQKITEDLEIFTKKIMEAEGISQYELNVKGQTELGVNYGSEIIFFSVCSKTSGKNYDLVMKTTKRSEASRKALGDGVADKREVHMYFKVFPALRKMLADSNSDYQLENITKTYLINEENEHETVIMEDLRTQGYRMWNKQKPMNLEHIKTVLSNYANYHASSMALRIKNPKEFNELTKDMDNLFKYFIENENLIKLFRGYVDDSLIILQEAGLHDISKRFEKLPENVLNILGRTIDEEDRLVITHGDCWNTNMMFKYQNPESTQPIGMRFLDFQVSSFSSPALDLSYFIYASIDEETLANKFEELLQFYYDSLATTLTNLGLIPDKIFTYQQLKEHWRKHAITGLIIAPSALKIQLVDKDEAPDLKNTEDGADWSALKVGDIRNNDIYKSRLIAVYKNYVDTCSD